MIDFQSLNRRARGHGGAIEEIQNRGEVGSGRFARQRSGRRGSAGPTLGGIYGITRLLAFITMSAFMTSATSSFSQDQPIGEFDDHADIGTPQNPGSAVYDAAAQTYTLTASGANIWNKSDQFHFMWKKMKGDFLLRARVEFIGKGVDPHRKLGWMVRSNLDADAPYVDCAEHGSGLTSLQYRKTKGDVTLQIESGITNADVIQFERRGSNYIFSAAKFGEPFVTNQFSAIELPDDVYVGLFLCAHNPNVTEKAVFHDVRIVKPMRAGFTPYRDYIGSVLEILDVESGHTQVVHRSAQPFEAPNWMRDGRALIYNVSGRFTGWGALCRFDLATKRITPIDTGLANRNNNDHVLSFDGTMLGISDQSATNGGQSTVCTVPVGGGVPKRITQHSPSYFHGWSPDGKFLVFTGIRNGKTDIYKIPSDGGDEVALTHGEGVNDGPEYTPDGKWIYFNSTRTGRMQLWRMKPDGSDPEQVTNDEFNDWFPHVSPDGKWIAFISFMPDVEPKDHPYYKHIYLRLMPVTGGAPRVMAYIYGGQGTMNVPSWSPDSKRLAFVSNTDGF